MLEKNYKIQKSNFTNMGNDTSKIEAPMIYFQVLNMSIQINQLTLPFYEGFSAFSPLLSLNMGLDSSDYRYPKDRHKVEH